MITRKFNQVLFSCKDCPKYKDVRDGIDTHHSYCYFLNVHSPVTTAYDDQNFLDDWFNNKCPLEIN